MTSRKILSVLIAVDDVKKMWSTHKELYRKCLQRRKRQQLSGAAASKLPTCKLFHQMRFLQPIIEAPPTQISHNLQSLPQEQIPSSPVQPRKRRRNDIVDDLIVEELRKGRVEEDENTLFAKSLAHSLNRLNNRDCAMEKIRMMQIILEFQQEE